MSLRAKLLLAQIPLVVALVLLAVVGATAGSQLGRAARTILRDNTRSIADAEEMKEAAERVHEAALAAALAGSGTEDRDAIARGRAAFERALADQTANITEPGEREATGRLSTAWGEFSSAIDRLLPLEDRDARRDAHSAAVRPAFLRVKAAADEIEKLNHDAMHRKSAAASRRSSARARCSAASSRSRRPSPSRRVCSGRSPC